VAERSPLDSADLRPVYLSAAGNRFVVWDGFVQELPGDPAAAAVELCAAGALRVDGLLLLARPLAGGDCRMVLYNKDGSRPEACGNGLRCIAKLAVDRGHVRKDVLAIETDAGLRVVGVLHGALGVERAQSSMGVPRLAPPVALQVVGRELCVHPVELGNPHCVLLVDDVRTVPVDQLGPALERHAHFPRRTNVEFVAPDARGLVVRIWERGVGETASCGSGASACAAVALALGTVSSPVRVATRGGPLTVSWNGEGELWLAGPVEAVDPDEEPPAR
jgi:diaminopimelate epimerase